MTAVVSEDYALQQLKKVIDLREAWLQQQNVLMNCKMHDKERRPQFLEWAKKQYRSEGGQLLRQAEGRSQIGQRQAVASTNQWWSREQQRMLGSPALWHFISFDGRFDAQFLTLVDEEANASQPGAR